jgi:hypothetical protein
MSATTNPELESLRATISHAKTELEARKVRVLTEAEKVQNELVIKREGDGIAEMEKRESELVALLATDETPKKAKS